MTKTPLMISAHDADLRSQLLANPSVAQFALLDADPSSWVDRLADEACSIAVVQADGLTQHQCDLLVDRGLLSHKEIIFLSNGEPNPFIDRAMHHGACYHLRQPLDMAFLEDLLNDVYQECRYRSTVSENAVSSDLDQYGLLVGSSPVMRKLYRVIRKAADSTTNVFVIGESGVGKELVANSIHLVSPNSDKPFVAVNCGALSPELIESELFGHLKGAFTGAVKDRLGVFEQAEGGTLFLDEVTEMPLDQQVKLLRVLETGEYRPVGSEKIKQATVRVIAATNRDPMQAIKDEVFREDLYFRLAHFPVWVPPLRDREQDIEGLAKHFLAYRNTEDDTKKEISVDALSEIAQHSWPGNVRELKHTIERAFILADDVIETEHLGLHAVVTDTVGVAPTVPAGIPLDEIERRVIMKTLSENDGNKSLTAEQLGISVKTLYNKLEKYSQV